MRGRILLHLRPSVEASGDVRHNKAHSDTDKMAAGDSMDCDHSVAKPSTRTGSDMQFAVRVGTTLAAMSGNLHKNISLTLFFCLVFYSSFLCGQDVTPPQLVSHAGVLHTNSELGSCSDRVEGPVDLPSQPPTSPIDTGV